MILGGLRYLHGKMMAAGMDRAAFPWKNGRGDFEVVFFGDEVPMALLFGLKANSLPSKRKSGRTTPSLPSWAISTVSYALPWALKTPTPRTLSAQIGSSRASPLTVYDGCAEARVGEGFGPAGEGLVGRDRDGGFLFAFGEDLEEKICAAFVQFHVAKLVNAQ